MHLFIFICLFFLRYLFNCQNWLSTSDGDGKICRELPAIDPDQIKKVKFRPGAKNLKDQYLLETEGLILFFMSILLFYLQTYFTIF